MAGTLGNTPGSVIDFSLAMRIAFGVGKSSQFLTRASLLVAEAYSLTKLPDELAQKIFDACPLKEQQKLAATCSTFRDLWYQPSVHSSTEAAPSGETNAECHRLWQQERAKEFVEQLFAERACVVAKLQSPLTTLGRARVFDLTGEEQFVCISHYEVQVCLDSRRLSLLLQDGSWLPLLTKHVGRCFKSLVMGSLDLQRGYSMAEVIGTSIVSLRVGHNRQLPLSHTEAEAIELFFSTAPTEMSTDRFYIAARWTLCQTTAPDSRFWRVPSASASCVELAEMLAVQG